MNQRALARSLDATVEDCVNTVGVDVNTASAPLLARASALANKFVKDPHEVVKPGQIVKVKVMDVDVKRQRISLTMRLDDAPGTSSRSGDARPPEPRRAPEREQKPGGAIALALECAKLKK